MTLRKASHTRRSFQKAYRFANIKRHLQITPAINTVQFFWVCFNKIIGKDVPMLCSETQAETCHYGY